MRQSACTSAASDVDLIHAWNEVRERLAASLCAYSNTQHSIQAHSLWRNIQDLSKIKEGIVDVVKVKLALIYQRLGITLHRVSEIDATETECIQQILGRNVLAFHATIRTNTLNLSHNTANFLDLAAILFALGCIFCTLLCLFH